MPRKRTTETVDETVDTVELVENVDTDVAPTTAPQPSKAAGDIESLLEERRGYVRRHLTDRIAQVDAELARYGVKPE